MTSKTITVTEKAYEEIKRLKHPNESFSEVLIRLAHLSNGQNLEQFVGAWDIEDDEMEQIWQEIQNVKKNSKKLSVDLD